MPESSSNPPVSRERFYRPELDLLRFVAFLMIFIHHAMPDELFRIRGLPLFTGMCVFGMQIFFVLSSYLITELLLREQESTNSVHIPAFFARRILRIWPLYFAFTGAWLLASRLDTNIVFPLHAFLAYMLLAGNWWVVFHGFVGGAVSPLWSISLEEQFYLLWPFVLRAGARRLAWIASSVSFIGAYLALFYITGRHASPTALWTNSFVEFQYFAEGAILALLLHRKTFAPPPFIRVLLLLAGPGFFTVAILVFRFASAKPIFAQQAPAFLCVALGVCCCFLAITHCKLPAFFSPIVYLGKISYGLYVFHSFSLDLCIGWFGHSPIRNSSILYLAMRVLTAFCITIGIALLSYRYLELPFLHLKRKFSYVRSRED